MIDRTNQNNNTQFSENTIAALCTPKGSGAIALIRLSGKDAFTIADKFCLLQSKNKLSNVESNTIHYGQIYSNNNIVDQVMFIVMKAPKTFTGENVLEITCHNNPFIIEKIITLAIENGARLAQPGEFAKRAFLNGKIDLIQAESINELLGAHTQDALKKSLSNLEGSFSKFVTDIEFKLTRCLALCDASFEFLDDEIEFGPQIKTEIETILNDIQNIKTTFDSKQQIKEGIRIALIGSVNAGKSSLFNALLNKNRAIVSSQAGTTRDSIEAGIYTTDHFITLVDTAGLRQTNDVIEQEGIKRSFEEAAKADIILLILDGSITLTTQEEEIYNQILQQHINKIIKIVNKADMISNPVNLNTKQGSVFISTKDKTNIDLLQNIIKEKINTLFSKNDSPFLLNQRQFNLLIQLETKLFIVEDMLNIITEYELLSIHLNEALQTISELTGKSISEKSMDTIFKEFCVGK